jgi:hypothetical protein
LNTPTHAILNLALLSRKARPQWNPLIIWGALIPDLTMFVFYGWMKATRVLEAQIWQVEYFKPGWQTFFDGFHSIPLALVGLGAMVYTRRPGIALLFGSIILHALADLPVHNDDAHRHFWPLSNFRWISPVSYWDPRHYGNIVGPVESLLMLMASIYVFRRVKSRLSKGLLIVANGLPLLAHLWFSGWFSG